MIKEKKKPKPKYWQKNQNKTRQLMYLVKLTNDDPRFFYCCVSYGKMSWNFSAAFKF
jgi:hypothetical protein